MYVTILALWCGVMLALSLWMATWPELQFHHVIPKAEPGDDPITESKEHFQLSINLFIVGGLLATLATLAWLTRDNLIAALWMCGIVLCIYLHTHFKAWKADKEILRITRLRDSSGVDAAIDEVRRLIETDGDTPDRRHSLGSLYIDKEDWQAALDELDAVVAGDPASNPFAHVARAVPLWHLGRRDEAEPLLIEGLKLNRWDAKSYVLYAHLMAEAGRLDEARRVMPAVETLWKTRPLTDFDREHLAGKVDELRHWCGEAVQPEFG